MALDSAPLTACSWPVGRADGAPRTARRGRALWLVLAAATLVAPRPAPAAVLSRDQPVTPRRIVSLIPAVTEVLFAIGAGDRVIGVGSYDRVPAEVEHLPRVGGLIDPDTEQILALRPDLVIVFRTQVDLQEQLDRASIPYFAYEDGTLTDILTTIRALGARTGQREQAAALAATIERDLGALRARVGDRRPVWTLLVFAREPYAIRNVFASGGIGFIHDLLTAAGGANVFAEVERKAVQASTETILRAAPDVIIEVRYGPEMTDEARRREIAAWQALPGVPAVRNDQVYFLLGSELVVPGPRVADAALRLARVLHPGAVEPASVTAPAPQPEPD